MIILWEGQKLDGKKKQGKRLKFWDGKTSRRIVKILANSAG